MRARYYVMNTGTDTTVELISEYIRDHLHETADYQLNLFG